jgi:hypothetical protein
MKFSVAFTALVVAIAGGSSGARAGELLVVDELAGTVGQYDATTGATINASFISGLTNGPRDMKLSGGDLYITSNSGPVGQYNASTGGTINSSFVSGIGYSTAIAFSGSNYDVVGILPSRYVNGYTPSGLAFSDAPSAAFGAWGAAVLGNTLYISLLPGDMAGQGTIAEYNATTGALINANFITGLSEPEGITISGNNLYVVNNAGDDGPHGLLANVGSIGEYNATTGAAINASLVPNLYQPVATVVVGNDIYVTSNPDVVGQPGYPNNTGVVGEYDATSGATINASLITGFQDPQGIVYMTPEPATWIMLAIGASALLACGLRKRWPQSRVGT